LRPQEVDARRRIAHVLATPALLRPVFQPILSLVAGNVVGYEAFSRFATEPVRPPERWFAEATRVGLGPELQALAIERILAIATGAGLPDQAFLSLNVSPRYLAHPSVDAALAGADPSLLVVELTEEEAVHDYGALRRAMAPHVERGVRFAVDDAGAGFASMRHVTELGPAYVKLDAYLIRGMRNRRTLQAFLRAINGFTSEIGATLIAEGVEGAGDLAVLTQTGFPLLAQGFGIARPGAPWPRVSATAGQAWFAASHDRPRSATPSRWRAGGRRRQPSDGIPIESGVNIGDVLAASLRGAGIDSLDTLRALGAVAAWRQLRAVEPEVATDRTLLALEGAIRGVRWGTLPRAERRKLIDAITLE
jgi:EAL domain-containing protein (putative c-di-GMP-specific phosphodiesterase class I)